MKKKAAFKSCMFSSLIFITGLSCTKDRDDLLYEPVVTFEGVVLDNTIELPGHRGSPNTCQLTGDTVVIFCYSNTFDNGVNSKMTGLRLWVQINPFTVDTVKQFARAHVLIRYSDFATNSLTQETLVAYPQDTAWAGAFETTGDIVFLERKHGGRIDIKGIYSELHYENHVAVDGKILNGRIYGRIE